MFTYEPGVPFILRRSERVEVVVETLYGPRPRQEGNGAFNFRLVILVNERASRPAVRSDPIEFLSYVKSPDSFHHFRDLLVRAEYNHAFRLGFRGELLDDAVVVFLVGNARVLAQALFNRYANVPRCQQNLELLERLYRTMRTRLRNTAIIQ